MTCRAMMISPPFILNAECPMERAVTLLLGNGHAALPVVNDEGEYMGMFSLRHALSEALPRIALMEEARIDDLNFVHDKLNDLKQRFDAKANEPIIHHLEKEIPVLNPDTSLMEVILLLYRSPEGVLPVLENHKVIGLVCASRTLAKIAGKV